MELDLYQVDAFSASRFAGNPAAVCPLKGWLDDAVMQAVAAENNLSETAFFVREGEGYALRWFTPVCEVQLCGHATLASAYVIMTRLEPKRSAVRFATRYSGELVVTRDGELFKLDFPSLPPSRLADVDVAAVSAAVGGPIREAWSAVKTMAVLGSEAEVRAAVPRMDLIGNLPADGLIITAPGEEVDFVARYFAPHRGIPEDPVTGSAYCTLTPYWAKRLGKSRLMARQVSKRGGELVVEDAGVRVFISGAVAPYLVGKISV